VGARRACDLHVGALDLNEVLTLDARIDWKLRSQVGALGLFWVETMGMAPIKRVSASLASALIIDYRGARTSPRCHVDDVDVDSRQSVEMTR
jgi:hypothetical protein